MLAPVAVFAFNRRDSLFRLLKSLSECKYSEVTPVYLFVDGARNEKDQHEINLIRQNVLELYAGKFLSFTVHFRTQNFGLAKSLRSGIDEVFVEHSRIIVLEDDLLLSSNFLAYVNDALNYYDGDKRVASISGYSNVVGDSELDNYFHVRPCSWGWATWKSNWEECEWSFQPKSKLGFKELKDLCKPVGDDVYRMYCQNINGVINSWAIMWTIYHIRFGLLSAYPFVSKVKNTGFDNLGTHCRGSNPFKTNFENVSNDKFNFDSTPKLDSKVVKRFNWYFSNLYKLLCKLKKMFRYIQSFG